jgi:uncharacterized damage-inducible protein DinB
MLLSYLDAYRETIIFKAEGLNEEQVRWRPTPGANSLLNLVVHLAGVEGRWTEQILLGKAHERDREAEFGELEGTTLARAIAAYRAAYGRTNDVVREIGSLETACPGETGYSVRWVLLHLLEETARHAGHADITRELIDGTVGG